MGLLRKSAALVEDAGSSRRRLRSKIAGASLSSSAFLFAAAFDAGGRSLLLGVDAAEPEEGFESCRVVSGFGCACVARLFNRVNVPAGVAKGGGATVCTEAADVMSEGLASRGRLVAGIFLSGVPELNLGAGVFG